MIETASLPDFFDSVAVSAFSAVPCSNLQPLINFAARDRHFTMAPNEGDAVAFAAGYWLGGKHCAVLMQNSGLGNAVSPFTSLLHAFQIPLLTFVSLRGQPGTEDEPQHALMGNITVPLLELLQVESSLLSESTTSLSGHTQEILTAREQRKSYAFVVEKGVFSKENIFQKTKFLRSPTIATLQNRRPQLPKRAAVLESMLASVPQHAAVIATTGFTGRELFALEDRPGNFYMVGSMGCASSIALGVASAQPQTPVIVLDGDGALLMRLGNLSMLGARVPQNIFHLLLNNEQHESTGGQATSAGNTDFTTIAQASGYSASHFIHDCSELEQRLKHWLAAPQCTFACLPISPGTLTNLPRPTINPAAVAIRFREFLGRQ